MPVDPKYAKGEVTGSYLTGSWHNQQHLTLASTEAAQSYTIWTVLWPERTGSVPPALNAVWTLGALVISRPDGKTDRLRLDDHSLALE